MKTIFAFFFLLFIGTYIHAQELAGEWRGYFTYESFSNSTPALQSNISLSISINSDGSYKIFSYSNIKNNYGQDSIITCRVIYKKTGKNSFQLKEESDDSAMDRRMLQVMSLRLVHKKNRLLLKGEWKSSNAQDISHGFMHFEKVAVIKPGN